MPKLLEQKLKKEYPNNPNAVYGTMNKIGAMKGNQETSKGKVIEKKMEVAKKMPQLSQRDQYNKAMTSAQKKGGSNGIGVGY